jgi:hypothetical protein
MPEKIMSTFIYQNGVLHADTRKIVNFPGREMITTQTESKVFTDKWCYIATAGFELSPFELNQIKKALTVIQSCYDVAKTVKEATRGIKPQIHTNAFLTDLKTFENLAITAMSNLIKTTPFLAVTHNRVFGFEGELAPGKMVASISVQNTDSVEVIGSQQHAARVLLLNGVPAPDIYPILRQGNVPTGETCEKFEIKKLKNLAAPWTNPAVWWFVSFALGKEGNDLSSGEKDIAADMLMTLPSLGETKWTSNYPDVDAIQKAVAGWRKKEHRNSSAYKSYRERMN